MSRPHTAMAGASSIPAGLKVQGTKGFGRGRSLHASRDFEPGELVSAFDPLVAFPDAANAKTTCHHCLAPNVRVVGCTGCDKAVKYCGAECQKANWKLVHAKECVAFQRVKKAVGKSWLPTPVRSLVQLLLRWPEVQPVVDGLEGNVDRFKSRNELWENMKLQAYAGIHYAGRREDDANLHMALEILCKIQTNSFDRHDADTGQSGTFLNGILAMVNHSCLPNAVVVFSRRKAYLRAETAIKSGDEITISYIDYTQPLPFRRLELELYHFECVCQRCSDDLDVYQVCQRSSLVGLNTGCFSPGVGRLSKPQIDEGLARRPEWRSQVEAIYAACARRGGSRETTVDQRLGRLKANWSHCSPLVAARMWALEPLAQTFQLATLYFLASDKPANALSTACFLALYCDPYHYVAPFKHCRLTGLMLIAKILTQASEVDDERLRREADARIVSWMDRSDRASISQAILLLVTTLAPLGYSDDWTVLEEARVMLAGIESVPGRVEASSLLHRWASTTGPSGSINGGADADEGRSFFEARVLRPVEELAQLAVDLIDMEMRLSS